MSVSALSFTHDTTAKELKRVSDEFENASPEAILRWAGEEFGPDIAVATGFGAEGCVLIAMLSGIRAGARIFYLDTDLLFPETYAIPGQPAASNPNDRDGLEVFDPVPALA
jgi:phosphoadenosine phosphosulfate reductase